MKALILTAKVTSILLKVLHALVAVIIVFALAYIVGGRDYLAGRWGTDTGSALSTAAWIDNYFPNVPFWYPLAGGGVSITHSYPMLAFIMVSLIKRLFNLQLIEAFIFLSVSSVPLMALGIYSFVTLRFKNQTAALLASVFYVLSPVAWTWLTDWGFYAETVSHIFVFPAIIFWDLFFTSFISDPKRRRTRVYLILTVILSSLAFFTHFGTFFSLLTFFAFYIIGYTLKEKERKTVFVRGIIGLLIVTALTVGLTLLSAYPFYRYTKIASFGGLPGGVNFQQLKEGEVVFDEIVSFKPSIVGPGQDVFYPKALRHVSFPAIVFLLSLLGIVFAFSKPRNLTMALFVAFSLVLSINSHFLYWVAKNIPWPFGASVSWRFTFIELRGMLPILAAVGLTQTLGLPLFWLKGKLSLVKNSIVAVSAIVISLFLLYRLGNLPKPEGLPYNFGAGGVNLADIWMVNQNTCWAENTYDYIKNYEGLESFETGGTALWCRSPLKKYFLPTGVWGECLRFGEKDPLLPVLCLPEKLTDDQARDYWEECQRKGAGPRSVFCALAYKPLFEQLQPSNWPKPNIVSKLPSYQIEPQVAKIASESPNARIDFSTYSSGLAIQGQYYNIDRAISQLYLYAVSGSSLMSRFYGQATSALYIMDPFYGKDPVFVNNLARWFGLKYLLLDNNNDHDLFASPTWEVWDLVLDSEGKEVGRFVKFTDINPLFELSSKPTVLVIGQDKYGAYDQAYMIANYGVLSNDKYNLVRGTGAVDDYTAEELKNFKVIILYGYTYKDQSTTDKLLTDYVTGGGRLYIDTGWQYIAKDWQSQNNKKTLSVIPFTKLSWRELDRQAAFVLEDSLFADKVDTTKFAPLVYYTDPWGVSTSEKSDLKSWAKPVLSYQGLPIVVNGKIGQGEIIWSGLNFFNHAKQGSSIYYDEIRFLSNVFSQLTSGLTSKIYHVDFTRPNPDKIIFTSNEGTESNTFLLWKEAYHPDFRALYINKDNSSQSDLRVYRAGPGMTLISVPKLASGDKVIYQYAEPFTEKLSLVLSVLVLVSFPVIVLEGYALGNKSILDRSVGFLEKLVNAVFFGVWKKVRGWWGKSGDEE